MKTVLIVEDSPTQREMIVRLLQDSNLIIITASNGVEALEQINLRSPT